MCMAFGYNPQINFCHFFHSLNLVIFGSITTESYGHLIPCERNSSYNFISILLKLYRCFCQGRKICFTLLIAGEIKTIGGGIRVPWTLFLV